MFNDINQLDDIINDLSEQKYNDMKKSVINNFELAKKFLIADDLIYNKLKEVKQ